MYHSDSSQTPHFSGKRNLLKHFLSIKRLKSFPNTPLLVSLHRTLHFYLEISFLVGGQLADLPNFEVSDSSGDGGAGDYRQWMTSLPGSSFLLQTTSPELHWFGRRKKKSKQRGPTFSFIFFFNFQVALSVAKNDAASCVTSRMSQTQIWVSPIYVYFWLIFQKMLLLVGKFAKMINFIGGNLTPGSQFFLRFPGA